MHYHDNELWIVAAYHESNYDSAIKRYVVEVWTREGNHFTRTEEIPLTKEDGSTAFQGAKRRKHDYLNRGMLHKNSKNIVLFSGYRMHVFERASGQRVAKNHWTSGCHWLFYNLASQKFNYGDCACYSYNKVVEIRGYDPTSQLVKDATPEVEIPIVLDEIKQSIKNELQAQNEEEVKEEAKEGEETKDSEEAKEIKKEQKKRTQPKMNYVRYLMGIDANDTTNLATDPVPAITNQISDIHAQAKAIIYSFISVEANYSMKAAQYKEDSPPHGSDMMDYFRSRNSVNLNREFLNHIAKKLKLAILAN